ncbi:hypothetical protein D920_00331 [Enterococcus faecalis 13-SD-W-01]|nr:hypothetical protein D920_00331 [Enterococcus faecalis 13-SD-W-01]
MDMVKKITFFVDILIPVIAFINVITLGFTRDYLVTRIAQRSLFLVLVYLLCSFFTKRTKNQSYWSFTKVIVALTALLLTVLLFFQR